MTKRYNMAGWRVGFCAGNAEMVKALATIKGYYDYGIFAPIQIASIIAMRQCEQTRRRSRRSSTSSAATWSAAAWTSSAGRTRSRGPACSSGRKINHAHLKAGEGTHRLLPAHDG